MTSAPAVLAQGDAAAGYPKQPIKILVGFAAGGSNDIIAHIVGQKLSERLGEATTCTSFHDPAPAEICRGWPPARP